MSWNKWPNALFHSKHAVMQKAAAAFVEAGEGSVAGAAAEGERKAAESHMVLVNTPHAIIHGI